MELQESVFQTLFEAAQIARFTPVERQAYEDSLKYYRDLKNVTDTARDEGKEEGLAEGLARGRAEGWEDARRELVVTMHGNGLEVPAIARALSLEEAVVRRLLG